MQTENFLAIDSDTQTINDAIPVSQRDEEIQVTPMRATVELNTVTTKYADTQIETDLVYYVTLWHISEQLETNRKDLNHCMEWIGECEKMMLVATKAIDQQ